MPGQFSDTGGLRALDAVTGRATVTTRPTYLALLTTAPTDAQVAGTIAMTEYLTVGANGYTRQLVTWTTPVVDGTSTLPTSSNGTSMTFGPFTGSISGTVTHAALVTATTGTSGDLVAWWQLDASRTPATNDAITVTTAALVLNVE